MTDEQETAWESRARNLAMMVRRLTAMIDRYAIDVDDPMPGPCSKLLRQAEDLLRRYGLNGTILREDDCEQRKAKQ